VQSRIDNPEALATFGTQDIERKQKKTKNTTQKDFVVYLYAKCYVKMSRVMTSTECAVGGRLSSYRLTTGAIWPSLLSDKK
jgi:hypothetical protein